jgi:predicted nucleotidyltransferase component of viral defense system
MIQPSEIEQKAAEFEINTSDVQRDYVFGWFLFGLFSMSGLKDHLFLKGGNALRKGYFESTRYSSDLDFGTERDINQAFLQTEINKVCEFVTEQTRITFDNARNVVREKFAIDVEAKNQLKVYEARVYFADFYGNSKHITIKIQMDITRFDRLYLPTQPRPLIHPYSDLESVKGMIVCAKLEEIVAAKMKCLVQREHPPDLFDYVYSVFFNQTIALNKQEVVSAFLRKTIFEPSPGVAKKILLELPFEVFREFWRRNIVCAKGVFFDVDMAITRFKEGVQEMFALYPETSWNDFAYFPAEMRNPMMRGGRTQTLLKIVYKDRERLVEPYALKYKQPQEGRAREYFFAYDLSGGSSGVPGIRTFVAQNMQSVENTETTFVPRESYEIELAKAGEPVEDKYFGNPDRPRTMKLARTLRRSATAPRRGPKYTYQCVQCYKKITKRRMDSTLGPHKNRFGGECYGRYGQLIRTSY